MPPLDGTERHRRVHFPRNSTPTNGLAGSNRGLRQIKKHQRKVGVFDGAFSNRRTSLAESDYYQVMATC
jgi:hypothetical protein